jgi:hypothetical protein
MQKYLSKCTYLIFGLALISIIGILCISNQAKAQTSTEKNNSNENVTEEQLTNEINFAMNDATNHDKDGNVTSVNTNEIKQRYGYVPKEYQQLQSDINNGTQVQNSLVTEEAGYKTSQACFEDKINSYMGSFIPLTAITAMYNNPNPKNIKNFSTKAIKAGLKGNAASVAAVITYNYTICKNNYPTPGENVS